MEYYASAADYRALFPEGEIPEEQLPGALAEAQRDVDGLTYNRIVRRGFSSLTDFQRDLVKRAVCAQAEFRWQYQDILFTPLASYGINGVTMAFRADALVERSGVVTTPQVDGMLRQTGLTYRGVGG